jgi:hypothetical protein
MNALQYILMASGCLSITYLIYLIIFKNETNFNQLRIYILGSIVISLLIPLSSYAIRIDARILKYKENRLSGNSINYRDHYEIPELKNDNYKSLETGINTKAFNLKIKWLEIIKLIYYLIAIGLIVKVIVQISLLIFHFYKSTKLRQKNFIILSNHPYMNSFSFFKWIFIRKGLSGEDSEKIIAHEIIHATQYHSLDLIVIELLAAVMWFNPFVWMMRNTLQLVHEYLADEGVLSTGVDKLNYQALLINQVTEEKLICLSSSFNHSLIKKRMIMMTKSKFNQKIKIKSLVLVPVSILLFFAIACVNGQKNDNSKNATTIFPQIPPPPSPPSSFAENGAVIISPEKMNVFYLGVDNPVDVSVAGVQADKINIEVTNAKFIKRGDSYIIRPVSPGNSWVVVYATIDNTIREMNRMEFRVKTVPDPVAKINGIKIAGKIKKSDLLAQPGISAEMENFDFDLTFKITEFTVSATIDGVSNIFKSSSNNFTSEQYKLFSKLKPEQNVYIEDIKCNGPDDMIRQLGSIKLEVY